MKNIYYSGENINKSARTFCSCRLIIFLLLFSQISFGQALKLPFFEDFSTTKGSLPDKKLWKNGGATINNTFAIGQPSLGLATFDGRDAIGVPYNYVVQTSYGSTDSLTSLPIDLSAFSAKDSLYLSFFWQAKGLGEMPDAEDSLVVTGLDKSGNWKPIWRQGGGIGVDSLKRFFQKLVAIKDPSFFHQNFQFRFQAKGRQSGPFDTWNVDYIYLNKGRNYKDIFYKDLACRQINSTFLKRYFAMPLKQFLVNPAKEINDSLKVEIYNLDAGNKLNNFNFSVRDTVTKKIFQAFTLIGNNNFGSQTSNISGIKLSPLPGITNEKKLYLQYQFKLITQDNINSLGIDLSRNDSISHFVALDDYYAYDDGTAEIGADIDQRFGKVAVQFVLSKPDTISAARFNFSPYFSDVSGKFFLLQIYDESLTGKDPKPGRLRLQQSVKIDNLSKYKINDFQEFLLEQNIAVTDTFYVGWTKISEDVIGVGVDKNTEQFKDKIYYSTGTDWIQNTSLKGSLMVRPVVGNKSKNLTITATEEEKVEELIAFPNPNDGILHWNLPNIKQVKVFDLLGKEILTKNIQPIENQAISIENLETGIYFVNFSDGKKSYTRKIIKIR